MAEHHLTRAKRLREEALAKEQDTEIVELEAKVAKLEKELARPCHVFNARAELVSYAHSEEEAKEILKGYPNGFIKLI
jgi:hypothetical protein